MTMTLNALPHDAARARPAAAVLLPYMNLPHGAWLAMAATSSPRNAQLAALMACHPHASATTWERSHDV